MIREMKNSGIEWIGEIPADWRVENLQWNMTEIIEKNFPVKMTSVLSLTKEKGVIPYEDKGNQGNKSKESFEEYKIAYKDTIVANSMNILIGSVGISNYDGCVSPVYYVFKNTKKTDLRYLNYIFTTEQFQKQLRKYANGIMEIRLRVSSENIMKQKVMFPTLKEQEKIADFLDSKVAEIDKIISEAKLSIENYKEYKKVIITEAVTKGIDKNIQMKNSGIEWIGEIPADWKLAKLNQISTKTISYGVVKLFEPDDNGTFVLRCSDVKDGYIVRDNIRTITTELSNEYKRTILTSGDVVVTVRGTLGGCAVVPEDMNNYNIAREVALISPERDKYCSDFIMYVMLSKCFENYRDYFLSGCIYLGINMDILSKFICAVPDIAEQKKIADFLNKKCNQIELAIKEKEALVSNLEEYKKSLIYEYVTGKKLV